MYLGTGMLACAFPLMVAGLALSVAGLARPDCFCLLTGAGNVLIGAGISLQGAPLGVPQAGAVNLTVGVALLAWWWLRRRRRRRARRWLGLKSAAIRAGLVLRMREAAQPA